MSKTWYPIINKDTCTECGACIDKCSRGVYDKAKAPVPEVTNPDGCLQGCTGCGSLCPVDAIEYFGNTEDKQESSCCSSGCGCDENSKSDDAECGCDDGGCSSEDTGCGCC